jgi:hypothetical protein
MKSGFPVPGVFKYLEDILKIIEKIIRLEGFNKQIKAGPKK